MNISITICDRSMRFICIVGTIASKKQTRHVFPFPLKRRGYNQFFTHANHRLIHPLKCPLELRGRKPLVSPALLSLSLRPGRAVGSCITALTELH